MIFLISLLPLLCVSIFSNAILRHRTKPAYVISFLLIGYANIVFISQIASLLSRITPDFYVVSHFILGFFSWILWRVVGKHPLSGPFSDGRWKIWRGMPSFRTVPGLYIMGLGVIIAFLGGAALILATPQNNYDSMTYHLSRIGYWMQHKNLAPWLTPNPRQTTSPINAELGLLWTTLLSGTDRLTGFVQWFSALGTAVTIFGLARLMGAKRSQGAFAGMIWLTFPQIILQSTTTQNDIVVTFFFTSTLYFLFLGLKTKEKSQFILSGIGFGLAVGTKATAFLILPGLGIAALVIWILAGKGVYKNLLLWGCYCVLGFGLFGMFNYVQNFTYYGDPISVPDWTSTVFATGKRVSRLTRGLSNISLYSIDLIDFTGLPNSIADPLDDAKSSAMQRVFYESRIPSHISKSFPSSVITSAPVVINEDSSAFGPLSIVLLPLPLIQLWEGIRKRDKVRVGLVIVGIGFIITLSYLLGWTPFRIRYFVLPVSILAPLLAVFYQPGTTRRYINGSIAILGLWVMFSSVIQNHSKPLIGPNPIWGKESIEIRMNNNQKMAPVLEMVEMHVPWNAVLGTRLGVDHWDYVLFGDEFAREIIQLDPRYMGIDNSYLQEYGIEYIIISPRERPFLEIPEGLNFIDEESDWYLFSCSEYKLVNVPKMISERLLGLSDEKGLLEIDNKFLGEVGLTEFYFQNWDIESSGNNGIKWLGEGLNQGLRGFFWAENEIPVVIDYYLEPGPSREDAERNLRVRHYRYGSYGPVPEGAIGNEFQIINPERHSLVTYFQHGLNEIRIYDVDRATIPELPNGDKRPLLTLLTQIDVKPLDFSSKVVSIAGKLDDSIQVSEQHLTEWGWETGGTGTFLWLGESFEQGFQAYIWSEQEETVRINLELLAGPSRDDTTRKLGISIERHGYFEDSDPVNKVIQFDGQIQYSMDVKLYKGLNLLKLGALDEATIDVLPNGDARPLLIQLQGIAILPINE